MKRLRLTLSLLLCLGLALTGGTMAVMRGQMAQSFTMVICTGHGTATVTLDADGNPVDFMHACPDCTLTLAVPGFDSPVVAPRALRWTALRPPVALAAPLPVAWVAVLARGPPRALS